MFVFASVYVCRYESSLVIVIQLKCSENQFQELHVQHTQHAVRMHAHVQHARPLCTQAPTLVPTPLKALSCPVGRRCGSSSFLVTCSPQRFATLGPLCGAWRCHARVLLAADCCLGQSGVLLHRRRLFDAGGRGGLLRTCSLGYVAAGRAEG